MALLLEGHDGIIQIGPTNALTTVGYVTEFSVECSTELTNKGPYIGDATIYKVRQAKTSSGTLSADIPEGLDPGQTGLVDAHEGGSNLRLHLKADATTAAGYSYIAANAGITGVTFGGNAEEGYTFEFAFEDMDGYSLSESA